MSLSCDSHFLNKMGGQSYLPEVKRGRAWGGGSGYTGNRKGHFGVREGS